MTKLKTAAYLACAALALLLGNSCTPQEQPGGAVTITLSSSLPETRGAAEVADGSEIFIDRSGANPVPDLILLIFDENGALAAAYPDGDRSVLVADPVPTGNDMRIRFTKGTDGNPLPEGDYTVYGLANSAGLWALSDGTSTINAGEFSKESLISLAGTRSVTPQAEAEALYFTPLFAEDSPSKPNPDLRESPNNRMPLTAKASLNVNANGNGSADLQLKRCVAQVVVKFVNNYGEELTLEDFSVTLHGINASTGYLFQHDPDIPTGTVYGNVAKEASEVTLLDNTNPANDPYEASSFVFPGTGDYLCDISFTVTAVGGSSLNPERDFEFEDLPVHNNRGQDITSIARNQKLTITVTISQGEMLSFSFEVGDWTERTETVTFD